MACRRKVPCALCRLPIVDGKDEAILCEGSCQQWYHRGCASLPPERYKDLSSSDEPFYCLTCTCITLKKEMSALSSTVTNLRNELHGALKMHESISELKNEIYALKESLKDVRHQLKEAKQSRPQSRPQQPRSYAAVSNANGAAKPKHKVSTTRQRIETNGKNRAENTSATQSKPRSDHIKEAAVEKRIVPGARRVWGPFHLCSPNAVLGCIKKLTSTDAKLRIRKKTKDLANNKTIWWFVIHGDEKDLCTLDEDWHKVHLQTSWRLESCFAPIATDSGNTRSSSNTPANPVEHDANLSTPNVRSATKVAATTSKDVSTSPKVVEPTPANIVTTLTDASQPSINHPNQPNKNIGMSISDESPINHSNCNDNVIREDENSHA